MLDNKIVGNGTDATVGDFDEARTTGLLRIVRPIFAAERTTVPAGLTADQVTTNAYIDRSIGMG